MANKEASNKDKKGCSKVYHFKYNNANIYM